MKKSKTKYFSIKAIGYIFLCFLLCQCKQKLPKEPAPVPEIKWTGPEEGWPPRLANMESKEYVLKVDSERLSPQLIKKSKETVLQNSRIKNLIGSRYIITAVVEPETLKDVPVSREIKNVNVYIYSYTFNKPVLIQLQNNEVSKIDTLNNYVLSESNEEIETAIALAKTDTEIKQKSEGLEANASLIFPEKGKDGYGNRVFFVAFSEKNNRLPKFTATVDLTLNKIVHYN